MGANSEGIRVELLGSPRAWCDGVEVPLGPPKQRAVLGLLASRVNDVVSVDQIVDAVWGEDAPKTCSNGVHTYVAGLRRALEPGRGRGNSGAVLVSTASGYSLKVDPECIDAQVFARRHGAARRLRAEGDLEGAVTVLNPALHLWRGEAYAGVPGPFALVERTRLRDVRLTAIEEWAADMLSLDRHTEVIEVLTEAIVEEPLRERLPWLLMLGLYRCGRRAHALEVYRRTRVLLAEELGIEPGEQLSRLHERILASDPGLRAPAAESAAAEPVERRELPGPAQLPPTARGFVGRQSECDYLVEALTREERRGATRIAVVHGIAGVGKSAFALEVAHRLVDRFPDGQLFVDLCGSSGQRVPMAASEALGLMLVGLGVAEDQLPADVTSRTALYRSLLHGKRMLVVLDDAVDADQVRALIPPGSSGLIITSRRRQIDLTVREGAHRVQLVPLSIADSIELFRCLVGQARIDAQRDAVAALAQLCGRLPLALRVAAETLSASPRLLPAELAASYSGQRQVAHLRLADDIRPELSDVEVLVSPSFRPMAARLGLTRRVVPLRDEVFASRLEAGDTSETLPVICADATYVVTGALGAVGRAVVTDLVRRGAHNLLLVGQDAEDELGPDAAALLAAVRASGRRVVYRDAGCDGAEAIAAVCAGLVDLPPVRGVVHAEGAASFAVPAVTRTGT